MRLGIALSGRGAAVLVIGGLCLLTGAALGFPLLNLSGDLLLLALVLAAVLGVLELRGVELDVRMAAEAEPDGSWCVGVRALASRRAGPFGLALKVGRTWLPDVPVSLPDAAGHLLRLPPDAGLAPVQVRLRAFPLGLLAVSSRRKVARPVPAETPSPPEAPARRLASDLADAPFGGLREHRSGEGIRGIHWGASARLQRLVVRLREADEDARDPVRGARWPRDPGASIALDWLLLHAASAIAVLAAIAFSGASGLLGGATAGVAGALALAGSLLSARRQARPGRWLHAALYLGLLVVLAGFLLRAQHPAAARGAMVELVVWVMALFAWDLRNRAYLGAQQLFALLTVAVLPAFLPPSDTPWVGLTYGLTLLGLLLASWADGRHSIGYARVRLSDLEALPSRWVPLGLIGLVAYLAQPWLPAIPLPALPTFGLAPARDAARPGEATQLPGESGAIALDARWPGGTGTVLRLEGAEPLRLRVETFDRYHAGRWSRTPHRSLEEPVRPGHPPHRWLTLLVPGVAQLPLPETTVGVLTPLERPRLRHDGSLSNPAGLRTGYRYRVALGDEPAWRRSAPSDTERTRDGLPAPLAAIARSYAAGAATPAETLTRLHARIRGAARYDLEAPRPPAGVDPTLYFLTTSRRGACVHYASALAILGRSLGIPTRLVVGYAPGARGASEVAYREGDAHAWVEAYLDGRWESFDPTPAVGDRPKRGLDPRAWLLGGLLLGLLAFFLVRRRRSGVAAEYQRALWRLKRRGVPITPATSAQEALRLAADVLPEGEHEALAALVRRYDAERFAPLAGKRNETPDPLSPLARASAYLRRRRNGG